MGVTAAGADPDLTIDVIDGSVPPPVGSESYSVGGQYTNEQFIDPGSVSIQKGVQKRTG